MPSIPRLFPFFRVCPWRRRVMLALAAACIPALLAGKPLREGPAGIVLLDNCDRDFKDKPRYADHLSLIDATGKIRVRVAGFNNAGGIGSNHRVAVDSERGFLWTIEDASPRLRKFDRRGKELVMVNDVRANSLAVDPETGNIWVTISKGTIYGDHTAVYDKDGKLLMTHTVSGWDIAYDKKGKAFWLAGKNLHKIPASQFRPTGSKDIQTTPNIAAWCSASLAVDPRTGGVWVACRAYRADFGKDELLGFDQAGVLKATISLEKNGPVGPFHVSVDARRGDVWGTLHGRAVRRYTAAGKLDVELPFPALAAQAEETTGGAWVVTGEETLLINRAGEIARRVRHERFSSEVWIAPVP